MFHKQKMKQSNFRISKFSKKIRLISLIRLILEHVCVPSLQTLVKFKNLSTHVMCTADVQLWQQPHASTVSTVVHKGTNEKSQQSYRGSTSWGVSGTLGFSGTLKCMYWDTCDRITHKWTCLLQLKVVGSSHKDAPDALLPERALSGPTSWRSWVTEPTPCCVQPFLY